MSNVISCDWVGSPKSNQGNGLVNDLTVELEQLSTKMNNLRKPPPSADKSEQISAVNAEEFIHANRLKTPSRKSR